VATVARLTLSMPKVSDGSAADNPQSRPGRPPKWVGSTPQNEGVGGSTGERTDWYGIHVASAGLLRARDELRRLADDAQPSQLGEGIARAVMHVAPYQLCAVLTCDPDTLLPSGGTVRGFSPKECGPFWDNELLDPDFNKFSDLARRTDPVATLVEAVDGDLYRSPRYAKLYAEVGASDELRVAFVAGSACLGYAAFVRCGEVDFGGEFTAGEVADVGALVPVATAALRRAQGSISRESGYEPPVVAIIDGHGQVTHLSAGGEQILADLRVRDDWDGGLPALIEVPAAKVRSSRTSQTVTTRLRGQSGRLVRVHVSPLAGDESSVVVTVENARPDDCAAALLASYDLTKRETEIALLLCRGLTAKEIATEMVLSVHTIRDHIKSIYEKSGVRSRGELMADLFSNHILDRLDSSITHFG
jgi:DNA-binding CsgD family transcriptional regulator